MDTKKHTYGLVGYPVSHSLSSYMHNAAFAALGINAEYNLFSIEPDNLYEFLSSLSDRKIDGLNVTIPYKEEILRFEGLDTESFYVEKIRAVNTIVWEKNKWKAFNTDAPGFIKDLKEHIDPSGKKVAILGAGGAAKAILYTVAESQAKEIVVHDIDINKGYDLINKMRSLFPDTDIKFVESFSQFNTKDKDILINATPVGMKKEDPCLFSQDMLHKDLFVYDVIYNPKETKLLSLAKKVGAKTANGLGMLLYQGMLSFEIWTGREPPKEVMWQALTSRLYSK